MSQKKPKPFSGTSMPFAGITDERMLSDLVAYLRSTSNER